LGGWREPRPEYSLPTHSHPVEIDANLSGCSNTLEQVI
jgi:hypothetical protein